MQRPKINFDIEIDRLKEQISAAMVQNSLCTVRSDLLYYLIQNKFCSSVFLAGFLSSFILLFVYFVLIFSFVSIYLFTKLFIYLWFDLF